MMKLKGTIEELNDGWGFIRVRIGDNQPTGDLAYFNFKNTFFDRKPRTGCFVKFDAYEQGEYGNVTYRANNVVFDNEESERFEQALEQAAIEREARWARNAKIAAFALICGIGYLVF